MVIGSGPPLRVADLPSPPTGWLEIARIIGPSVIVLGMGIGAGEWLLAPAAAVKYGTSILRIATIAIIIQTLAFIEAVRYTMYTGEPLTTGIMRLKPGPLFWPPALTNAGSKLGMACVGFRSGNSYSVSVPRKA